MANLPISGLTASASNLASTDVAPVVQTTGVGPVKMTGLQLAGGLLGSATFNGSTVTTSQPVLNLSQTWNAGAVPFTGLKFNATDTASAAASLLLDLQVGGVTAASISKSGVINLANGSAIITPNNSGATNFQYLNNGFKLIDVLGQMRFGFSGNIFGISTSGTISGATISTLDTILRSAGTGILALGNADAAAPVAQTLQVQSVVGSTPGATDVAGANWTIKGSAGRGSGAGGSIIFQVAPAGSAGTGAQNAYATALTIASSGAATFASTVTASGFLMPVAGTIGNGTNLLAIGSGNIYPANSSLSLGTFAVPFSFLAVGTASNAAILTADAANTLALRNSTNAQTFNIYGTYTDVTNYERMGIRYSPSNDYEFVVDKGTTGTYRSLTVTTYGNATATFESDTVKVANNGRIAWCSTATSRGTVDTVLVRGGAANVIGIGGATSSFPALKRKTSSATLQVRVADDTAFSNIEAAQFVSPPTALTSGATITWNANTSSVATLTLDQVGATLTISNAVAGGTYLVVITQGTGGNKTITTWTSFKWQGGAAPTLSTSAGAIDVVTAVYDGTSFYATAQIGFA